MMKEIQWKRKKCKHCGKFNEQDVIYLHVEAGDEEGIEKFVEQVQDWMNEFPSVPKLIGLMD